MYKKFLFSLFFCIALPFFAFSSCQKNSAEPPSVQELSSENFDKPTPLPIFPSEIDPAQPPAPSNIWDVSDVDISEIDTARKLISFTFDDSPARTLENILAVFADFNEHNPDCKASATLFCNGYRFDKQTPHLLATALALGFDLGNHTYSHPDLTLLSDEEIQKEITRTDALLSRADGKEQHLFRPPFGKIAEAQKGTLSSPIINWTIDTLDWKDTEEEQIYQTVMSQKFSGAIVLMHDGYENTVSALKRLLPDLKSAGYQVVSLSKISKAHNCPFRNGKEYIRARKQSTV
ncbi:MAG: polysaccharide deacetylase family protein [Clostridia bacterium]|nr:polysaccharide deacetylase family protein [Clostridia bacterium]